jgi:uncharacterized protein
VTNFGAFVDVGVHQDGLVHISELSDRFVKSPADVVNVQQTVTVTVLDVDLPRKRIALSMRSQPGQKATTKEKRTQPGGKKPGNRRPKPPRGGAKPSPKPFNNPFADAFGDSSRR